MSTGPATTAGVAHPRRDSVERWNTARRWAGWLRLNRRVAGLLLRRRWLEPGDFEASYDRLARHYGHNWLCRLWPVTLDLLEHLPAPPAGPLLDLGCGVGSGTAWLAERHPDREIVGVDISRGMLAEARRRLSATPGLDSAPISWVHADMLDHLRALPDSSYALVFSGWAIGYSQPGAVITEAARVLRSGGGLGFVVNCADTLAPVFRSFRETMQRHPESLARAAILHFPAGDASLARDLARAGLETLWRDEGWHPIGDPPGPPGEPKLPWLLHTGVLAGFDTMLPLAESGPVADFFEQRLSAHMAREPLRHHYVAAIARKP